jgi:hypothetical protein
VHLFSNPSPVGLATILHCPRFETSLFVASYDSQGYGGDIRPGSTRETSSVWSAIPLRESFADWREHLIEQLDFIRCCENNFSRYRCNRGSPSRCLATDSIVSFRCLGNYSSELSPLCRLLGIPPQYDVGPTFAFSKPHSILEGTCTSCEHSLAEFYTILLEEHLQVA